VKGSVQFDLTPKVESLLSLAPSLTCDLTRASSIFGIKNVHIHNFIAILDARCERG